MRKRFAPSICLVLLVNCGLGAALAADGATSAVLAGTAAYASHATKATALGTIEPVEVVDVCSQVTGTVAGFGPDPHAVGKLIDFNSQVEPGTVLAKLDSKRYEVAVEQGRAGYATAVANLGLAKANAAKAEADYKRNQELYKLHAIAESDMEAFRAAWEVSKASISVAAAAVEQAKANLHAAELDLDYTIIRSPVKGVVIDRRVNMGETVTAGHSASSLFLIANIEKMEIWASVNEADIAKICPQQAAHFTVEAFPGKVFKGTVKQIRLNARMTRNVVTYTVLIAMPTRPEGLLPYMTAKVEFE